MSLPSSSARLLQPPQTAPFVASHKQTAKADSVASHKIAPEPQSVASHKQAAKAEPVASHKTAPEPQSVASHKQPQTAQSVASHKTVKVKAGQGDGAKSKTIKYSSLKFRVRLSDRGYRVMLLTVENGERHEPYLCSLRRSEWAKVKNDTAAFLTKVKDKLRDRIRKNEDGDRDKLPALLQQIEEATQ